MKDGELVIHVDYSENYKNKKQSEIKAGYYGQGRFSLFTVAIYMKQNDDTVCKNYALLTRENDHSCNISFELNNFILSTMQANYDIKTVKFWSEGCVSQFRSQFDFFMLSKVDHSINIEWNHFEANHGKGVVDGIGGTVKHAVYSHVLTELSSNSQSSLPSMQMKHCQKLLFSMWRMNPWSSYINQNAEKKQQKLEEH